MSLDAETALIEEEAALVMRRACVRGEAVQNCDRYSGEERMLR